MDHDRPSRARIAQVYSWLSDAAVELVFAEPCADWRSVARCLQGATSALSDPRHEQELWDYLAPVRDAITQHDSQAASWLLDAMINDLRLGALWPEPEPAGGADDYYGQHELA